MSDPTPIVFVLDADVCVRESVEDLAFTLGLRCEGFASALQFLARPPSAAPCCLVLDVDLPDMDGLDLQAQLVAARHALSIIFVARCQDVRISVQAMKSGALEFLTKPYDPGTLARAVEGAVERSRSILAREATQRALRERLELLTQREREVMALVVAGHLNKQVGGELGISEITVKAHRGKVMRKMQATSLAHLVGIAALLRSAPALPNGRSSSPTSASGAARFSSQLQQAGNSL